MAAKKSTKGTSAKKPAAKSKSTTKPKTAAKAKAKAKSPVKPKNKGGRPAAKKPQQKAPASGTNLKPAQQALRDSLMLAREHQNWPIEAIAKEAGLTVTGARAALKKRKEAPTKLLDVDPVEILERLVQGMTGDIADFQAMALAYSEKNPSAAVGAKKAAAAVRVNLLELFQSVGVLPYELGQFSVLIDLRGVVATIVSSVDDFIAKTEARVKAKEITAKQGKSIIEDARMVGGVLDQIGGVEEADGPPVLEGKAVST